MQQKSTLKLIIGILFLIIFMVFSLIYSEAQNTNERLESTNQKLKLVNIELKILKVEIQNLKQKINEFDIKQKDLENTNIPSDSANQSNYSKAQQLTSVTTTPPDNPMNSNNEPTECCESVKWDLMQEYKIRDVLEQQVSLGVDLSITDIKCEVDVCSISLFLHGENDISNLSRAMDKLTFDDVEQLNISTIEKTENGVNASITLKRIQLKGKVQEGG